MSNPNSAVATMSGMMKRSSSDLQSSDDGSAQFDGAAGASTDSGSNKKKLKSPTRAPSAASVGLNDFNATISDQMSREASLRTIQLIRMQNQQRRSIMASSSSEASQCPVDMGSSTATFQSAAAEREHCERQRIFASLVEAAAANNASLSGPGRSFVDGQQMSSYNSNQAMGQFANNSFQPNYSNFQPQNDLSFQVSQYLQMQADKRYLGHQSIMPNQQSFAPSSRFLQSRDYRMPNFGLAPRGVNMPNAMMAPQQGHSHMYGNNNMNSMQRFREEEEDFLLADLSSSRHNVPSMMAMARPAAAAAAGRDNEIAAFLPVVLSRPIDVLKVSNHQVFLRQQIEAFQATEDDVSTHTRGRNKPIALGQVGIRCRHCAHVPVLHRQKGSTYFPATTLGLYQAAQNMSTTHIQCGLCTHMPFHIKAQFAHIMAIKSTTSGAGRPYWAESAKQLGLVDTEDGIFFVRDLPPGARLLEADTTKTTK